MKTDHNNELDGERTGLEKLMKELFYRSDCPDNQMLNAYLWELVSDEERKQIESHLAECPHCPEDIKALKVESMTETEPKPVKNSLIDRLIFFPRFIQPAGHAVRSAVRGPVRFDQTYHIDELDWDIVLTGQIVAGQMFVLQGQLLGDIENEWERIEIYLIQVLEDDQQQAGKAGAGPDGIFTFSQLEAGDYAILIKTSEGEIPIPDITLKL